MVRERRNLITYGLAKEDGFWFLYRENGTFLEREEWLKLRAMVDAFYARDDVDDAKIARRNGEIVREEEERFARLQAESKRDESVPVPGHIYLMHGEGTHWYKIGLSVNPVRRLKNLGTQGPFAHCLLRSFPVDDMYGVEAVLHSHFASKRAGGEWFTLSEQDVKIIKGLKGRTPDAIFVELAASNV